MQTSNPAKKQTAGFSLKVRQCFQKKDTTQNFESLYSACFFPGVLKVSVYLKTAFQYLPRSLYKNLLHIKLYIICTRCLHFRQEVSWKNSSLKFPIAGSSTVSSITASQIKLQDAFWKTAGTKFARNRRWSIIHTRTFLRACPALQHFSRITSRQINGCQSALTGGSTVLSSFECVGHSSASRASQ